MVTSFPWLTALWAIPMLGAVSVMLLPAARRTLAKWVALAVSVAVLAVTAVVAIGFDPAGQQYQFVESHAWIPSFGTGYILGVDGIALALVVLTAVLVPLLIIAGWNDARDRLSWGGRSVHIYFALTLAVEGMVLISLVSLDILLFYVFFEAMLIPMYFLIGGFGGEHRSAAAVKFLLYNLFGGLIMLAAVVGLYVVTAQSEAFAAGTFDFRRIVAAVASGEFVVNPMVLHLLFGGFMFAFAVKAPLWP
ncbi:MAG: proton-conducting transporter membrane subunit, partial [Mycobacterium sp.]